LISCRSMRFKIDTKAHYRVFTLEEPALDANMAAELLQMLNNDAHARATSLILDLSGVKVLDASGMGAILTVYDTIYANNASCAIASLNTECCRALLKHSGHLDLNLVRTVSEGVDLVMMEYLERSLSGGEEI